MSEKKCSYEGCGRDVYRDGEKCIFHCEEKDPQEFRDALARQIREWRKSKADMWDFRGWVFIDVKLEGDFGLSVSNLFSRTIFPVDADFTESKFLEAVLFGSAKFLGDAVFEKAVFSQIAEFDSARFLGGAFFGAATFSGDAIFEKTELSDAFFSSVIFSNNAVFESARFSENTYFDSVTFSRNALFARATFGGALDLSNASFAVLGDFSNVTIIGPVRLRWPGLGFPQTREGKGFSAGHLLLDNIRFEKSNEGKEPLLDLRDCMLREDCKLIIKNTDLSHVLLTRTSCRQIEFYDIPNWAEWKGRSAVADEVFLRADQSKFGIKTWPNHGESDIPSWDEIAITYQQLVANFRKELDHPLANDFECGLFEARRMSAWVKKKWGQFLLFSLYKWASRYSGSLWRPVLWTLFFTLVCGLLYGAILYDGQFAWPWQTDLALAFRSAATALRVVTLDRGLIIREIGEVSGNEARLFWASLTAAFQIVMTAVMITLFIFSVRRRFKHSE